MVQKQRVGHLCRGSTTSTTAAAAAAAAAAEPQSPVQVETLHLQSVETLLLFLLLLFNFSVLLIFNFPSLHFSSPIPLPDFRLSVCFWCLV